VRHRGTGRLHHVSLVCAFTCTLASGFSAQADNLDQQRADYAAAIEAISLGDEEGYARLRGGLDDYPLAVYLDYYWLRRTVDDVSAEAARAFLDKSAETPLLNRFLSAYLREAGKSRRWQDFLTVKPDEPSSVYLKCYYFRAQLARGERALAWDGASRLWVHGESRPEECDPLFGAWLSAGQLNDDIVWTRLLNAFEARQPSLLNYVAKKSSPDLRPWADKLLAVYRDPATLRQQSLPSRHPRSRDIASYGLAYLARYSPPKALSYWTDLQQDMAFSSEQVRRVEHAIAQQLLFARTNRQEEWLQDVLARLEDDRLIGIRLRWALSEEDWTSVERYLPMFSENEQGKTAWRYWTAMVQEGRGDKEAARASLEKLAGERDYYGFLAADRLGLPYAFNDQQQDAQAVRLVDELPAVRRIEELIFHNDSVSAHAEWYRLLQSTDEIEELQNLMLLASGKGWHRMAIDAAARAEAWDALDHRFPAAHQSVFRQHAGIQSLPVTELMAIARRESAFDPRAESPVGARGLMQIMPATGKAVADSLKVPHSRAKLFEVEHNVKLGSAYYRQLLDRFDGNRVFALTAYNAGPHRVDRWRHESGEGLPVEFWIEAIPYRETRNYVQAVLAYNVVFQYLLGDTQQLLTPAERQAAY
jgi:soluble lytic murein transglycosylase